jgi:hypothetical protein
MKNLVGGTKSLEGGRCIAWAIISFNMEQLAHRSKDGQTVIYDMGVASPDLGEAKTKPEYVSMTTWI